MSVGVLFEPTEKQKTALCELRSGQYREVLFDGGARCGKTFLILMFIIFMCLKFPGLRVLIARLRFNHVKASIWNQDFPKILPQFNGLYKTNSTDYILRFINGSEIWLGGLDNKERTDKILGQEYGIIFFNEAVENSQAALDKVKTRLAQKIPGFRNLTIYDCNPRHPEHFIYKKFYVNKKPDQLQIHWTPFDNLNNLQPDYIAELEELGEEEKKRFLEGIWASLPGAVYTNIKAENIIDCSDNPNDYDDVVLGIDFGLYTAITAWGIKDDGRKAYCYKEVIFIGSKYTTTDIINELDKIFAIKDYRKTIYCDHEPDRITEIKNAGYCAKKAYKDVSPGDASVNSYELFFDKKCNNTFQSMLNLIHQKDNNEVFIEKHVKENDHEADSARYALHGYKMDNRRAKSVILRSIW